MSRREGTRLAALERTLVGAAADQAQKRRRRRRVVVAAAVAAPLTLAAAGSVASTDIVSSVEQHLSALRDDRLVDGSGAADAIARATGSLPRDPGRGRSWLIADHRVIGYTTPSGTFCFVFGKLMGGCLPKDTLTLRNPVDPFTDNGHGIFRLYGLAADGVTGVSLEARGRVRHATVGRNSFFLKANDFASPESFTGTLIVRLSDGTIRRMPIRVGGADPSHDRPSPRLPGSMPAANTAA